MASSEPETQSSRFTPIRRVRAMYRPGISLAVVACSLWGIRFQAVVRNAGSRLTWPTREACATFATDDIESSSWWLSPPESWLEGCWASDGGSAFRSPTNNGTRSSTSSFRTPSLLLYPRSCALSFRVSDWRSHTRSVAGVSSAGRYSRSRSTNCSRELGSLACRSAFEALCLWERQWSPCSPQIDPSDLPLEGRRREDVASKCIARLGVSFDPRGMSDARRLPDSSLHSGFQVHQSRRIAKH